MSKSTDKIRSHAGHFLSNLVKEGVKSNKKGKNDRHVHGNSEFEDNRAAIEHLSDQEVLSEFEKMLDDMNLAEEKKIPLRNKTLDQKKDLLAMHLKDSFQGGQAQAKSGVSSSSFSTPEEYIQYLSGVSDIKEEKVLRQIQSLRVALTNKPLNWVKQFGTKGTQTLLDVLCHCYRKRSEDDWYQVQYEVLRCLRSSMNNRFGFKVMLDIPASLDIVSMAINPRHPSVMKEAVSLLSIVAIATEESYSKVLHAITVSAEAKQCERFQPIVDGVKPSENRVLQIPCFIFINAIVSRAKDLHFRVHLRNEFMRSGLAEVLEDMMSNDELDEDLETQLNAFLEGRDADQEEFQDQFEQVKVEMGDMDSCFQVLRQFLDGSSAERSFLSILQHLLFIRDDPVARAQYFRLFEVIVSHIVLQNAGCDPNFKNLSFDMDLILDELRKGADGLFDGGISSEDREKKLRDALAKAEELEAENSMLKKRLESGVHHAPSVPGGGVSGATSPKVVPPPGLLSAGHTPTGGGPPPPPPPPMPPAMGAPGPPPPPPPPMPGVGGPPPPPPPPMPGGGPPPPPPPPGGIPMFGGPMGMMSPRMMGPEQLPFGMKPKKKWNVRNPLKKANWKKIPAQKLTDKAFWVKVQEEELAKDEIVGGLESKFATKPVAQANSGGTERKGIGSGGKRTRELRVLEPKVAQNLSILLGGHIKHMSYADVKRAILECNAEVLTESLMQQLIQYMPTPDQIRRLEAFKDEYNDLAEAEQFALTIGSIKRIVPRLKSLSFKERFSEVYDDVKENLRNASLACNEVKESDKFQKVLQLILLFGNVMNSGTKFGESVGFDISFLPKLSQTKDVDNKFTLIHFLVETVEKHYPDCLNFPADLMHTEQASRVNPDQVTKTLQQMSNNIKNLRLDLDNDKSQGPCDRFTEVMAPFCEDATKKFEIVEALSSRVESAYSDLSEFFVFEKTKYSMEEFFKDISAFKQDFTKSHKEILAHRETQEKIRQAEARRAERERLKQESQREALIDINADDDQVGCMDNLMQALQSGSAFSSQAPRRRRQNRQPLNEKKSMQRNRSRSNFDSRLEMLLTGESTNPSSQDPVASTSGTTAAAMRRARNGGPHRSAVNHRLNDRERTGSTG